MKRFQKTVDQGVLLFLTFSVLMPHQALAAGDLRIVAKTDKTVSKVSLMSPEQTSSECQPEEIKGVKGFTCNISDIDALSSIETYDIIIEGPDLQLQPTKIRVYPTMKRPATIDFDLTDTVFLKTFDESSHKYYLAWRDASDKRDKDDFSFLVVTQNYYARLKPSFDRGTAWVLRSWLERANVTASKRFIQAADTRPVDKIKETDARLSTDPEKQVFKEIFIEKERTFNENGLRYSDWLLFKSALKRRKPTDAKEQEEYCKLYEVFRQRQVVRGFSPTLGRG